MFITLVTSLATSVPTCLYTEQVFAVLFSVLMALALGLGNAQNTSTDKQLGPLQNIHGYFLRRSR
jgi:hypothetical protein